MADLPRLVFSGVDGIEAEDFIYHVRQKAFAEGKVQDKQWILNFASACFVRDALRWHASLDTRIQDDWALLQKALLARFRPVFRGIDGDECERFVAQVRQRALDEGKAEDNKWIIQTVTASFVGAALRWHATLDAEVRDDWILLQRAMFLQYPAPEMREESVVLRTPSYTVPFPAAAPAVATAFPALRKGRLRIDAVDASVSGYISCNPNAVGYIVTTNALSDAMQVGYKPASSPHDLDILNATGDYQLLGLKWNEATPSLVSTTTHHGYMVSIKGSSGNAITASWNGGSGSINSAIWTIGSDNSVSLAWTDPNSTLCSLTPRVVLSSRLVFITGNQSGYDTQTHVCKAKLVFEAM